MDLDVDAATGDARAMSDDGDRRDLVTKSVRLENEGG